MSIRPRRWRILLATVTLTALTALTGLAIAAVTHAVLGSWSPLPTSWPWDWSPTVIGRWLTQDAGSSDVVPVATRILCTLAWVLLE